MVLAVYNQYAVPGPDHVLFQGAFANFNPNAATAVDFTNDTRAPLLLMREAKIMWRFRRPCELQAIS